MKYKVWMENSHSYGLDKVLKNVYDINSISCSGTVSHIKKGFKGDTYVMFGEENEVKTFNIECIDVREDELGKEHALIFIEEYIDLTCD